MSEEATNEEVIQKVEIVEPTTPDPVEQIEAMLEAEDQPITNEEPVNEQTESNVDETENDVEEPVDETDGTDTDATDDDVEEITLANLHDIAENLGVDVSDLYNITVPITDPTTGEKVELPLGEWKDKVQETIKQEKEQVYEQLTAKEQQIQQAKAFYDQQIQQSMGLVQAMEQDLIGSIEGIDWNRLREEDPAEFAALTQDVEARKHQIEQYKQNIINNTNQQAQLAQREQAALYQQRLQVEQQQLLNAKPEWTNSERAQAEKSAISDYLVSNMGFAPEEAGSIIDHRFVLLAEKAMKYDQVKKATPNKKRVVKVGNKTIKPGASKTKQQRSADQHTAMKKKAMSGDEKALEDYFTSLL